tara:strand:+ start:8732 stop:9448 length:717 start_codon:yes stop_codon:yes gene_type:complete
MLYLINFIIIFIIFYTLNKSNLIEDFECNKDKNILLLTMCINTFNNNSKKDKKYRLDLYKKNIDNYLKNTNLDIYIVESSNDKILKNIYKDNNRINIHSFDLNNSKYMKNFPQSSTFYEIFSMYEAYKHFKLYKYNNIIKVTGRYYLPTIEKSLDNLDNNYKLYVQHRETKSKSKQTEIIGFKSYYFKNIFNEVIKQNKIFEHTITYLSKKDKCTNLPRLDLEYPVRRGGDKKVIYYL